MKTLLPLLLLVLVHHFLLAPLIRKKFSLYLGLLAALLVLYGVWCLNPVMAPPPPPKVGMEQPRPAGGQRPLRPEAMKLIMGVLLIGADLGLYFYVESRRRERRMKEMEAEFTKQRLESLRYQINPHFFMNTLNNIHALVDIDPEKAKESIEKFSKMMRILLYEGDAPTIPLAKELDFIEHFISLMRLRYPEESVRIDTVFPEAGSDAVVPPLVMASFVENAFKHGVSYSASSFIHIKVELQDGKVVFRCSNSYHPSGNDSHHGIGLENIRKRLTLLYGPSYDLAIDDAADRYDVLLTIPSKPDQNPS